MKASLKISNAKILETVATPCETQRDAIRRACLINATTRESELNIATIMQAFTERGIAERNIIPRRNVFTRYAWEDLGYRVKPDQAKLGVRVLTTRFFTDKVTKEKKSYLKGTFVYHVSQVELMPGVNG